jgi:hypothetical protein
MGDMADAFDGYSWDDPEEMEEASDAAAEGCLLDLTTAPPLQRESAEKSHEWKPIADARTDTFYRVFDRYSEQIVTGIKIKAVGVDGEDKGYAWFTGYTWGNVVGIVWPTHFMPLETPPEGVSKESATKGRRTNDAEGI